MYRKDIMGYYLEKKRSRNLELWERLVLSANLYFSGMASMRT